jgi:hypothetical protein
VLFTTDDRLVAADDETGLSLYEVVDGRRTRLLTPGLPSEGHSRPLTVLNAVSTDGLRVLANTGHAYSPLDTDNAMDLYLFDDGIPTLVTPPGNGGIGFVNAMTTMSADGRHVFFHSDPFDPDQIPEDTNGDVDTYEWVNGTIRVVTTGPTYTPPPANQSYYSPPGFGGVTADGSRAYFSHEGSLTADEPPSDTDSDVFVRTNGTTTTRIPIPGDPGDTAVAGVSADGSHLILNTASQLSPEDTDAFNDFYDLSGGTFTLLTDGQIGGEGVGPECGSPVPGSNLCFLIFNAVSQDGQHVYFTTRERLDPQDTDSAADIYEHSAGATRLASIGTLGGNSGQRVPAFEGISGDGRSLAFNTLEKLVPADTDGSDRDLYVRRGDVTTLVPSGPLDPREGPLAGPSFAALTYNGDTIIFLTSAKLVPGDNDHRDVDVYARIGIKTAKLGLASVARKHGKGKKRRKAKTKLISAERIPPRIRLSGRGRTSGGTARVRIGCPKKESSGGCKGSVKALGAGRGAFKLKRGRSAWISVGSAGAVGNAATVVVRGKDLLGNKATVRRRVSF